MKNIVLILLLLNISCKSNGQEREKNIKNYQQIKEVIKSVLPEEKNKKFSRIYNTYYTVNKDTVLLMTEEYKKNNKNKNDTITSSIKEEKEIKITKNEILVLFDNGYILLFKKNDNKYILLDEIKDEYETFYDDLGEAHETYFPTGNIEHYRNDEYIVTYSYEGGFKIGIFEINEKGIAKKFLSKGCLFYDEWSNFTFYEIKNGEVFINYLIDPEGEATGQIELEYENGGYSLNKDQCRE